MNTALAVSFISGQYDPEHKKAQHLGRIAQAKLNKPKTTVVKVVSEYRIEGVKSASLNKKGVPMYRAVGERCINLTENNTYSVIFKAYDRSVYVGTFKTLEEAIAERDKAQAEVKAGTYIYKGELLVDKRVKKDRGMPKHIYYNTSQNKYQVQKDINGKKKYYGAYKTLEEAIERLKELGYE